MLKRKAKLTGLSSREKRACRAHWIDGLTHAEIGRREGVSKWASMKRVQRARRKLREMGLQTRRRHPACRTPAFQLGTIENV
jgi:DNA-directed RNA polymerase specialized sigma24 family protein